MNNFGKIMVGGMTRISMDSTVNHGTLSIRYGIPIQLSENGKVFMRTGTSHNIKHVLARQAAFSLMKYFRKKQNNKVVRVESWEAVEIHRDDFYLFIDIVTEA